MWGLAEAENGDKQTPLQKKYFSADMMCRPGLLPLQIYAYLYIYIYIIIISGICHVETHTVSLCSGMRTAHIRLGTTWSVREADRNENWIIGGYSTSQIAIRMLLSL